MIWYFSTEEFRHIGFGFIHDRLTEIEPAPDYEKEKTGMEQLEKVLTLVRSDEYYPTFWDKAAYLITSIAASQYFSNGNKRLAIVVLLTFLSKNNIELLAADLYTALLQAFPDMHWEENMNIDHPHALFLYNLAIVLGNRSVWGTNDFGILRTKVAEMFRLLYKHES